MLAVKSRAVHECSRGIRRHRALKPSTFRSPPLPLAGQHAERQSRPRPLPLASQNPNGERQERARCWRPARPRPSRAFPATPVRRTPCGVLTAAARRVDSLARPGDEVTHPAPSLTNRRHRPRALRPRRETARPAGARRGRADDHRHAAAQHRRRGGQGGGGGGGGTGAGAGAGTGGASPPRAAVAGGFHPREYIAAAARFDKRSQPVVSGDARGNRKSGLKAPLVARGGGGLTCFFVFPCLESCRRCG